MDAPDSPHATKAPAIENSAELSQRVRSLEQVVALERKLRRRKERDAALLREQLQQAQLEVASSNSRASSAALGSAISAVSVGIAAAGPVEAEAKSGDMAISRASPAIPSGAGLGQSGHHPPPSAALHPQTASVISASYDPDATRIATLDRMVPDASARIALVLPPGFQLFEYRIDEVLGQGGFGITYLATDINLNSRFAVKEYLPADFSCRASDMSVVPRSPEDSQNYQTGLDNFLYEARTLASFRHPNIVRVARFFEAHRTAYIVLEYEQGQSLRQWWQQHLPEAELLALLQPLLDGLALVHEAGYLHRDIKPDNIMVRNSNGSLVLLDFGAARQTSSGNADLTPIVTPGYAPPEQYQGEVQGPWTDVYAFGATLYWMVAGSKPWPAPERAMSAQAMPTAEVLAQEKWPGRYSPAFLQAIDWAIQMPAEARPQSVAELSQRLFAAHTGSLGLQDALRLRLGDAVKQQLRLPWLRRAIQQVLHPANWPLGLKLSLALVLAALLPMTMTAYYNLKGSVASVSSAELRNLERLAQSVAGRVSQLLADSRHLADYIARDADFINYLRQPSQQAQVLVQGKIRDLLLANPNVNRVLLLDRHGIALASNDIGSVGSNSQFREYFRQAMAGRSFTTGMIVSHIDGSPGVYYANPVFDAQHQVVGAVVIRIKGASVGQIMNESTEGTGREPFVIDPDGIMIYHPDQKQLYHSLMPLPAQKQAEISADRRFGLPKIDSLNLPELASAISERKTHGNINYHAPNASSAQHAGYARVAGHDWVVGITEPTSQFEAPLNRLFNNVLYSVALVGLLFLLLALWFARSIVRPIQRLTDAAHALTEGDYDNANIKVDSNDEIGRLARTFNVMIDVLRQRERERGRAKARNAQRDAAKKP